MTDWKFYGLLGLLVWTILIVYGALFWQLLD